MMATAEIATRMIPATFVRRAMSFRTPITAHMLPGLSELARQITQMGLPAGPGMSKSFRCARWENAAASYLTSMTPFAGPRGTIPEFNEIGEEVWNENPADIINLSLGLFKTCPRSMQDAINSVTDAGVVVVAAAGNRSVPTEFFAPAGCENVVTVAGGDARGHLAPYSNYGAAVDVLAPGGDLARDDDGDGNPDGVLSTKTAENCEDPLTGAAVSTCYYAYEQGTSMATPHVAAALALIKSKRPDLSAEQLVSTLMSGVSSVSESQCTGPCAQFPGAIPTLDDPDMCVRPCGSGLLNLADITLPD
jgi:serine protease